MFFAFFSFNKPFLRNVKFLPICFSYIFLSTILTACSLAGKNYSSVLNTQNSANERKNIFQNIQNVQNFQDYTFIAHPQILKAYSGEYKNHKLERTIAQIVGNLIDAQENTFQNYRIVLLNSQNVNAFALPNGYVYITRGLLALANDSAEVAAVIAHEMAHIIAHHGLLRLQKEQEDTQENTYKGSVLSEQSQNTENQLSLAQFTRNQELEADAIGIQILSDAGYNPFAMAQFLKSMEEYRKFRNIEEGKNPKLDFLATHPATPQRISAAIEKAKQTKGAYTGVKDRKRLLHGINGLLYNAVNPKGFIRGTKFYSPLLRIAFAVPEDFFLETTPYAITAIGPKETALRFDVLPKPTLDDPKAYIKSGWVRGLDVSSVKPILLNHLNGAYANASNGNWKFTIIVLYTSRRVYRFLAASKNEQDANSIASYAADHLKFLKKRDVLTLKPLYLRVITTHKGDTIASLAKKVKGTEKKEQLFCILNGLQSNEILKPNSLVKIISE